MVENDNRGSANNHMRDAPVLFAKAITKSFTIRVNGRATPTRVLTGISFELRRGEVVTFFGANGAGKTTLIRILAGVEPCDSGDVILRTTSTTPFAEIAWVPQASDLFPWKTVAENVEFGLSARQVPKPLRAACVEEQLRALGLTEHESKRPHELSGGMRQRCAIARALAVRPTVLLLDEPFASLDYVVKRELQTLLLNIQHAQQLTIALVTHDPDDAVYLSSRILVLSKDKGQSIAEIPINLPYPRTRDLRFTEQFRSYVEELESYDCKNN